MLEVIMNGLRLTCLRIATAPEAFSPKQWSRWEPEHMMLHPQRVSLALVNKMLQSRPSPHQCPVQHKIRLSMSCLPRYEITHERRAKSDKLI